MGSVNSISTLKIHSNVLCPLTGGILLGLVNCDDVIPEFLNVIFREEIPPKAKIRPVPTDSNSRAYLGRDSERDPK